MLRTIDGYIRAVWGRYGLQGIITVAGLVAGLVAVFAGLAWLLWMIGVDVPGLLVRVVGA